MNENEYDHITIMMPRPILNVCRKDPCDMNKRGFDTAEISTQRLRVRVREILTKVRYSANSYKDPAHIYLGLYEFENVCLCQPPKLIAELPFPSTVYGIKIVFTPYFEGVLPTWEK